MTKRELLEALPTRAHFPEKRPKEPPGTQVARWLKNPETAAAVQSLTSADLADVAPWEVWFFAEWPKGLRRHVRDLDALDARLIAGARHWETGL